MTIEGREYIIPSSWWTKEHPGGFSIMQRFNNSDATKAFKNHSPYAFQLLENFAADKSSKNNSLGAIQGPRRRYFSKLFTEEDRDNAHKILGVYSLLHYFYRFGYSTFVDYRGGFQPTLQSLLMVLPHAALSLSSLKFYVPRERMPKKPMIWEEFRAHNIIFALRSFVSFIFLWTSMRMGQTPFSRKIATVGTGLTLLMANKGADIATKTLRLDSRESTTATMPYWPGCSEQTEKKFKTFYAYAQFMATLACLSCCSPAWPFVVAFPIQFASLLMTLVRKGLLPTKGYHYLYCGSLVMPFFVGISHTVQTRTIDFPLMVITGTLAFVTRLKLRLDKYALWVPMILTRVLVGDNLLYWDIPF
ncbi:unnamed protein product [Heterosigma akashiwo]